MPVVKVKDYLQDPKCFGRENFSTNNRKNFFELSSAVQKQISNEITEFIQSNRELNQKLLGYKIKIQEIKLVLCEPNEIYENDLQFKSDNIKFIKKTQTIRI